MTDLSEQQERFCRFIAEGMNQRDAYMAAGYKPSTVKSADECASRLSSNAKVAARIAELRGKAAKKTELTVAHFAKRLERIAAAAERTAFMAVASAEGASPADAEMLAVTAKEAADIARQHSMDAAKLLGLVVDKHEVEDKTVYAISNRPKTDDEWATEYSGKPN